MNQNRYIVNGNKRLTGTVSVGGSKNAALPILFATLASGGTSRIRNLPDITDVDVALSMLSDMGAIIKREGSTVNVDTSAVKYSPPDPKKTSLIRASSYLIGACLSRFGIFHISRFGGCNFCNRPIDLHLYAAGRLGAEIRGDLITSFGRLSGNTISFPQKSVGATINALIMASTARGTSKIECFAREPHVMNLIDYLSSAGADIQVGESAITVNGRDLASGDVAVIPDMIEAGTYLSAGVVTAGEVTVNGISPNELTGFLEALYASGVDIRCGERSVSVSGGAVRAFSVLTAPFTGYPTDLQPQIAPVMANHGGTIREGVWQNRFSYLSELARFGLVADVSGACARIAPSVLHSAKCRATDLRGGAAAVLMALATDGISEIYDPELIQRGYSDIAAKLNALGAEVEFLKGDT